MSDILAPQGYETNETLEDTDIIEVYQPTSSGVRRNKKALLSVLKDYFKKLSVFTANNLVQADATGTLRTTSLTTSEVTDTIIRSQNNATDINTLDSRIDGNDIDISSNASDISSNASNIASNGSDIASNGSDINTLQGRATTLETKTPQSYKTTDGVVFRTVAVNGGSTGVYSIGTNYGVRGDGPTGVYGTGTDFGVRGTAPTGVYGLGTDFGVRGNGPTGVYGIGTNYDFYASGPGTNYGPFTGAHEFTISGDIPIQGMIVSSTGKVLKNKNSISNLVQDCKISKNAKDINVFGVYVKSYELDESHWAYPKTLGIANALGDGQVLVTNINGNINCGDYITTSVISGHGQKQDDDILHSYTLGKCTETIDWDSITAVDGIKTWLAACVYTSA